MAEPQNFRSAFHGFNREDVVHYIEYANARHDSQLAQLRGELEQAQQELEQLRGELEQAQPAQDQSAAELTALQERCASLEAQNAALQEENRALTQTLQAQAAPEADHTEELAALQEQVMQLTQERDLAQEAARSSRTRTDEELAAYRRAERMERVARDRVGQMYHQANGTLADAGARLDDAAASLNQAAEEAASRLSALQAHIAQSKSALSDAADVLRGIRPQPENL